MSNTQRSNIESCSIDPKRPRYRVKIFMTVLLSLIVDQASKYGASGSSLMVINHGISFSLFPSVGLTLLLVILYIAFFEWSCPRWHQPYPIAIGFVLGGGLSNIIDRVVLGGVRDFLPVPFFGLTNNLADWMIVAGLAWICLREYMVDSKKASSYGK